MVAAVTVSAFDVEGYFRISISVHIITGACMRIIKACQRRVLIYSFSDIVRAIECRECDHSAKVGVHLGQN
ncbi:hypothetical protein AO064_29625 [Pseudomonas marginalis]|uniref:Uncharacterized protein n=2 Tax=Pseudomonas marginalis TaxID=298 RepID=A0A9X5KQG1_PSEMA|nr:hypothetical protein AO064_29625 [Pseudomonas marginalis]